MIFVLLGSLIVGFVMALFGVGLWNGCRAYDEHRTLLLCRDHAFNTKYGLY